MKKKIHIALVGGQSMPVFLGIEETRPDEMILVHSSQSQKEAQRIAAEYKGKATLRSFNPVEMETIKNDTHKLLDSVADDEVSINVSGGTKSWTIAFVQEAQQRENATLLYVDQNCVLYDYTHNRQWPTEVSFDMETLMKYNGQSPSKHMLLSDYDENDNHVLSQIRKILKLNYRAFNRLTIPTKYWKKELEKQEGDHKDQEAGGRVSWDKKKQSVSLSVWNKWRNTYEDFTLSSPHVFKIAFNSGWFEYQVASILRKWQYAQEVWINVAYPYREGSPKNEIDIVINTGVKLLMVECKTQIFDQTDIDKFRSAVKNYGGMACKSLFVTNASMRPQAQEKCRDNGILTFSLQNHPAQKECEQALFSLLDNEVLNLNTK